MVIECQRAAGDGDGPTAEQQQQQRDAAAAFRYASLLVTDPTYREALDPSLRRKFETIVRRGVSGGGGGDAGGEEEKEDDESAAAAVMCIASGRFMQQEGDGVEEMAPPAAWCRCPNSRMPALLREYRRFIDVDAALAPDGTATDPVCGQPIRKADLVAHGR